MEVSNPLVTVYIPTYNRIDLLKRAVESVLNQTYKNLEIIIVDDYSQDGTQDFLKELAEKNSRVHYILKEKNGGACESRNIAIEYATGEYITGLDDDDYLGENHIKKMVDQRGKLNNYCFLFAGLNYIDKNKKIINNRFFNVGEVECNDILFSNFVGNQIFTKTIILKENKFNPKLVAWQDLDCWFNILKNTNMKGLLIGLGEYYCDIGHDYDRITKSPKDKILRAFQIFCNENNLDDFQKKILSLHLLNYKISISFFDMFDIFLYIIYFKKTIFYYLLFKKFFLNTLLNLKIV